MTVQYEMCVFAVRITAEELFDLASDDLDKSTLGAEELRAYVRKDIEMMESWRSVAKLWQPLFEEDKQKALEQAIPDGTYPDAWEE